ncbi:NAD(P)H-binding protein [Brevibacterium sp. BRM-1]|uniref:NAD(P)H-binding protein n=1 Tax=Brevibacterium sp. BRM-1 TaxID=2999062 RepID=UPI002281BF54|nr:NAD(P)H-binding protein [Brevibacterium sp. BRM-1]WAL39400.1 NAD(P)H-binding protein [Brevibacterium sp. BRM-1]
MGPEQGRSEARARAGAARSQERATAGSAEQAGDQPRRALVTGATGYVGGTLVGELLRRGWAVRTLSRSRGKAESMPWAEAIVAQGQRAGAGEVEVCEGDASEFDDVAAAMEGTSAAWYLLHSMGSAADLMAEETAMARTFARAAETAGIDRIVYLAGLHPDDEELSEHLASRTAVGRILLDCAVPTAVLQAGVVLGDGSASFTMLRSLSERLPGAIGPRWIRNRITPIAVRDAMFYLASAAELPAEVNRAFDIGGPDTLEYAQMMQEYAKAVGLLPRLVLTAPVTTPGLAAHWIGLITPVRSGMARHLIGSLLNTTVVKERDLEGLVGTPPGGNLTFREAVRAAVEDLDTRRWSRVLGVSAAAAGTTAGLSGLLAAAVRRSAGIRTPIAGTGRLGGGAVRAVADAGSAGVAALVVADSLEEGDSRGARGAAAAFAAAGLGRIIGRAAAAAGSPAVRTAGIGLSAVCDAVLGRRAYASAPERAAVAAGATALSIAEEGRGSTAPR